MKSPTGIDIMLIRPDFDRADLLSFPMPLLALGSYLHSKGVNVGLLDFVYERIAKKSSYRNTLHEIFKNDSGIYGITVYFGQLLQALKIARFIKKHKPDATIIFGGPGVAGLEEKILTKFNHLVDFLCIGEGEITLHDLVSKLLSEDKNVSTVKGIAYYSRESSQVIRAGLRPLIDDFDQLPLVNYDLLDVSAYLKNLPFPHMNIIAGQGCPYNCTFCSTSQYWGRKYRTKSPERLIQEMTLLNEQYGITNFNLIHDNLLFSKQFYTEFETALAKHGNRFSWYAAARIDALSGDMLRRLSVSGCKEIFCGIESGSEGMQEAIGKRLQLDGIINKVKFAQEIGVRINLSFILDLPNESHQDREQTLELIFKLGAFTDSLIHVSPLAFLPLTQISHLKHTTNRFYTASDVTAAISLLKNHPHAMLAAKHLTDISLADFIKYYSKVNVFFENAIQAFLEENNHTWAIDMIMEVVKCDTAITSSAKHPIKVDDRKPNLFDRVGTRYHLLQTRIAFHDVVNSQIFRYDRSLFGLDDKLFISFRTGHSLIMKAVDRVIFDRLQALNGTIPIIWLIKDIVMLMFIPTRKAIRNFRLKQRALIYLLNNNLLGAENG